MSESSNKTAIEESIEQLVEQVTAGKVRIASRLITRAERGDSTLTPILKKLFSDGHDTPILGITGPPGAGKSTLVNQLVKYYRAAQQRVAVLAVDPSSPLSGGAILGDRVRMNEHAADPGVFIRSMAARGQLGGLSKATGDALTILQAMGFDKIILETVGVGQSEVDIMRHASTVAVLQIPGTGDSVQSVKAGVLEIGDIYVVNKADLKGADKLKGALEEMLHLKPKADDWKATVISCEAVTGKGIESLSKEVDRHIASVDQSPHHNTKAELRARHRVAEICSQLIQQSVFSEQGAPSTQIKAVIARQQDPYSLAEQIIAGGST